MFREEIHTYSEAEIREQCDRVVTEAPVEAAWFVRHCQRMLKEMALKY